MFPKRGFLEKKKPKWGNKSTQASNGSWCRSALEAHVYDMLLLFEKSGQIKDLKHEPSIHLKPYNIRWKVDFQYFNNETGEMEYSEAKGAEGERYVVCREIWRVRGPGTLFIWKGDYRRGELKLTITEKIVPKIAIVNQCPTCHEPNLSQSLLTLD